MNDINLNPHNQIFNENNLSTMNRFVNKFVNGIITSPPYNLNVERSDCYYNNGYSIMDNLKHDEYLNLRITEFNEFERILCNDGNNTIIMH